jgi:4-coumarate--CoA ligase
LIKVKGNQVAPAELEALLLKYPDVVYAAVEMLKCEMISLRALSLALTTIRDDDERPRAYNVPRKARKGAPVKEDKIIRFVADRVAKIKRITAGVVFADMIPKNAVCVSLESMSFRAVLCLMRSIFPRRPMFHSLGLY